MTSTQPPSPGGGPIPPGMGRLMLHASVARTAFQVHRNQVVLTVGGSARAGRWGWTAVDLPAGWHHLRVQILLSNATSWVYVPPGQVVTMYYRAPMLMFSRGALGAEPQPNPGLGLFVAILAAPVVLMVVGLVAALIAR